MQTTAHKFARNAIVTYRAGHGATVEASIRALHRDGSYTVEARFILDEAGQPRPCYLGFRYRMDEADLRGRS